MKLQTLGLMVALAATTTLAGCDLYFGSHNTNDTWQYCGADGQYTCQGSDCTWVSPTCTSGTGSGSSTGSGTTGYECQSNTDCAAGCYCLNGTCEEGGFCTTDADCGNGYHCDTMRSSCEPNPPQTTCDYDNQCPQGQYCDYTHHCAATCTCTSDAQAVQQGWGWCDESRQTCLPGADPAGTCAGDADTNTSCTTNEPHCPTGQVPTLFGGCYTGACRDLATCDAPPVCAHINDEPDCLERSTGATADCQAVYTGVNCTKPDGTACHAGDAGCTCQSFTFNSCADKNPSAVTVNSNGKPIVVTNAQ